MINEIEGVFKSIGKAWDRYLDWVIDLPGVIAAPIFLATAVSLATIIVFIVCFLPFSFSEVQKETVCLDSSLPRRYANTCEERQDGEWVEVDPFATNYRYNEAASREK